MLKLISSFKTNIFSSVMILYFIISDNVSKKRISNTSFFRGKVKLFESDFILFVNYSEYININNLKLKN